MSRFTWLGTTDAAAICGWSPNTARRVMSALDNEHWWHQRARVQACQLAAWFEQQGTKMPPLLLALVNDEREYPAWMSELRREFLYARKAGLANVDMRKPRVAAATTPEEARAILDSLPDIEARGYLDEGLPPEYEMADRLKLAWGDEDG